jgi:hypothetical protein
MQDLECHHGKKGFCMKYVIMSQGHVTCIGVRESYDTKTLREVSLGIPRHKLEDSIAVDYKEVDWDCVD